MGIELAKAYVAITADASGVPRGIASGLSNAESMVSGFASRVSGMLAAAGIAFGAVATGISAFTRAAKFEQTMIAFETMMGSAAEAKKTLADLTKFAAETPFEMPEIEQAARGLIMFGERGDQLMKTLKMLGNAAAGTSTDFGFIALVFNQVRGVGRLLTQDFRQLSTRGVLSLQDIAKHFGVTQAAADRMLSEGKVSFKDFAAILEGLSGPGGRFADMMEKQSKSLGGLWSTMKDNVGLAVRAMGEAFLPVAKEITSAMIGIADSVRAGMEKVREWVSKAEVVLKSWGLSWRDVGISVIKFGGALISFGLIAMTTVKTIRVLSSALALLQAGMGPIGLIGLALGAIAATGAYFALGSAMDKASEAMKKAQKELDAAKKSMEEGGGKKAAPGTEVTDRDVMEAEKAIKKIHEGVRKASSELYLLGKGVPSDLASSLADVDAKVFEFSEKVKGSKVHVDAFREALLRIVTLKTSIDMRKEFEKLNAEIFATIHQLNEYDKAIVAMMNRKDVGSRDKLMFVQLQRDLQRANAEESIRKIEDETRHLRDRMSEASIKIEEFNKANKGIGMEGSRFLFASAVKQQQRVKIDLEAGKVNDQLEALEKNASKSQIAIRDFKRQFSAKELVEFAPEIAKFEAAMKKLEWTEHEKKIRDVKDEIKFLSKGWSEATIAAYKFAQQPGVDQGQVNRFHAAQVELRKFQQAKELTGRFGFPDLGKKIQDIMLKQGEDEVPTILKEQLAVQQEQLELQKERKLFGPGEGYARLAK